MVHVGQSSVAGRALLRFCIGAALVVPSAVNAGPTSYALPDHYAFDKLGIDIGSLQYERRDTFLTIGDPANGGLSWTFVGHDDTDSYEGVISYWGPPAAGENVVQVRLAGNVTQFMECNTGTCVNWSGTGAKLVKSGSNWLFTSGDGSLYTFNVIDDMSSRTPNNPIVVLGKLLSINHPDGTLITINYVGGTTPYAIKSVVSSRGYALKYNITGGSPNTISAVNLANHTCDTTVTTCDGVDTSISIEQKFVFSALDGQNHYVTEITDTVGAKWLYGLISRDDWPTDPEATQWVFKDGIGYFKSPAGYEALLTLDEVLRLGTFTDNRGTWTFTYEEPPNMIKNGSPLRTFTVTDPNGAVFYKAKAVGGYASYSEDPLGNRTNYFYVGHTYTGGNQTGTINYSRLGSIQQPEQNSRAWSYDTRGNVTGVTNGAKPASGLSAIAISASYPGTCTNVFTCNRPTSETDAKGYVTNYTYDSTHGGVLSEMKPAPSTSAARPLKLTTWTQKTPYYRNPSGVLVASSTPIWVIATQTECQTVTGSNPPAACDTTKPIAVTTYEYGANGTANSLWPRGIAVTAEGNDPPALTTRRTCFTYDALGRKVSETKPAANLSSCP